MTLYLHIGAQKTGSTTIQAALHEHRDQLRALGLEYPEVEEGDPNQVSHYNSMRGFFSNNPQEVRSTQAFVSRVNKLQGDVLISTEVLSNWPANKSAETPEAYWKRKRAVLETMRDAFVQKDVRVIYCVRNRSSYLKSLFKQHLKVVSCPSLSIGDDLHQFLKKELLRSDSQGQISVFSQVFGDVRVIDFDEHARAGTLLPAFTSQLDREIDLRDAEVRNVSPDWADLEIKRLKRSLGLKGLNLPDGDQRAAYNAMAEDMVNSTISQALSRA